VPVPIALLGDLDLDLPTHRELAAAVDMFPPAVEARWVGTDSAAARSLDGIGGLWVFPGSPYRDDDAVDAAIGWALERRVAFLGTCGGFQYAALALARRLAGRGDAVHGEVEPGEPDPAVAPLACSLVGQERTVRCVPGTRLAAICGTAPFTGFHWCGYGLSDGLVAALEGAGVVISAHAPDAGAEGLEVPDHPFFLATLFQPQVGSLAGRPLHALIESFLEASCAPAEQPMD